MKFRSFETGDPPAGWGVQEQRGQFQEFARCLGFRPARQCLPVPQRAAFMQWWFGLFSNRHAVSGMAGGYSDFEFVF